MAKQKHPGRQAYYALLLATTALIVNFWAWSLISPLGAKYSDELALSATSLSILLATPVIIGSLGRILLGAATDKFGGKAVFALACFATALPVAALAFVQGYGQLVLAASLLGIGGATFAIGVPFVSSWFPPEKRGLVIGVYSMGNVGTAVSGFLTPRLEDVIGRRWTFLLVALLLLVLAYVFLTSARNAPAWKPAKDSIISRFALATKSRVTWDLSMVYVITFGAFVAFGVYLPLLLKVSYGLSLTDAASRAAGFVLIATVARPIGGWLSDKIGGTNVIRAALVAVVVLAGFVATQTTLQHQTTAAYLSLAFALGCTNGAVFALIGKLTRPDIIGSVTGIVGAVGGLGGFFPPLILGITYQQTNSYAIAFFMLAGSALAVLLYVLYRFSRPAYRAT